MGVLSLISVFLLGWGTLAGAPSAWAKPFPMVESAEVVSNNSASFGGSYSVGASTQVYLGSADDQSNRTGDLHSSFARQFAPLDPSDPHSLTKQTTNWAGGFSTKPFGKVSIGIDFDSASDHTLQVFTDGAKGIVSYEFLRLSYRFSRSIIEQSLTTTKIAGKNTILLPHDGAFIYQKTVELGVELAPGEGNELALSAAYSAFTPDASRFGDVLGLQGLQSLSSFQDTLQSFEQYFYGFEFKRALDERFDAKLALRIVHGVITANTLLETSVAAGMKFAENWHAQLGWDYSHDITNKQNNYTFELRYSWARQ